MPVNTIARQFAPRAGRWARPRGFEDRGALAGAHAPGSRLRTHRAQTARRRSAVPVRDLGQRLANNPILSSRDVVPSQAALEVVSVFNASAATVGEETILLLRVGERPRAM